MFIILEGENKCGKTSLAKRLHNLTGWEIIHFGQPKKEPYIEYVEFLLNRKEPAILDRFYLGEKVYGPLWRGKSELNEWQTRMIEMLLMARNSLNIYCETDEKTIIENFKKEQEEFAKAEQIPDILRYFRKAVKESRLDWVNFNYRKDPAYAKIQETILHWLSVWKQNERYLKMLIDTRAIGNPFAKNVIVGDICNGDLEIQKYKHIILPFAKGVSSNYLWEAIDGISKNRYLMTNVRKYHHKGQIELGDILQSRAQKIICLGNNAFGDINNHIPKGELPFRKITKVKHPAWGSRFMIDPELYSEGIKNELV